MILLKKKDIELRDRRAKEGNTFYIHVPTIADEILCREYNVTRHQPKTIIGKARISEVKYYDTTDEFMKDYSRHYYKSYKYNYGFILDRAEKTERPIENVPGKRYFFFI